MTREIHLSQRVTAPPEAVFRCFEDPILMKQWIEGLEDFQYLDPPAASAVGRRFRQVNRIGGRRVVYEGKIVAWELSRRFAAEVESSTFFYRMDFRLEKSGEETVVDYRGELLIRSPLGRLFGRLITFFSRAVFARELKRLKAAAEGYLEADK